MTIATRTSSIQSAEAALALMRKRAWDDLYYFAKFVVGFDLMCEVPHRELCDLLVAGVTSSPQLGIVCAPLNITNQRETLRKLILLARGTFKSSISTQAFPLWLLWHNPNLRILIDSETMHNARSYLAGIRSIIESNQMVRLVCTDAKGNYTLLPAYSTANGFTEESVILATRTNPNLKEPSIFCSGVDNARTGMHVDVIIMDDLVSERNVTTLLQIEKTYDHYRMSRSLLDPGGLQIVIGTRYHMGDMYGQLIDLHRRDDSDDVNSMSILVRPAVSLSGELYFPTRLTQKFLDDQRKAQGSYIFSCQYQLDPIDELDAVFRKSDLQLYDVIPNDRIISKFMAVDFTLSAEQKADFFVCMCAGITRENHIYVIEYVHEKMTTRAQLREIVEMWKRMIFDNKVRGVGIEVYAAQKALKFALQDEMKRQAAHFKIVPLTHGRSSKEDHIMTKLQPFVERQEIFIRPHMVDLLSEFEEYPRVAHDDLLDTLAYITMMMRPGGNNFERKQCAYVPVSSKTGY